MRQSAIVDATTLRASRCGHFLHGRSTGNRDGGLPLLRWQRNLREEHPATMPSRYECRGPASDGQRHFIREFRSDSAGHTRRQSDGMMLAPAPCVCYSPRPPCLYSKLFLPVLVSHPVAQARQAGRDTAAIDRDLGAADKTGLVGGEEQNQFGAFEARVLAMQWDPSARCVREGFAAALEKPGIGDLARMDRVDPGTP